MRLIDADAIHWWKGEDENGNPVYIIDKRDIDKEPTAYSVEKVIEELEEVAYVDEDVNSFVDLEDATEIVKQGGVSNNVCEWTLDGVYLHSPHKPLVSCVTDENYRYYYCPVCGKKIKVVE